MIINRPPESINVNYEKKFSIIFTAISKEPLSYQWYKNVNGINKAVSNSYTDISASDNDAELYYCKVNNDCVKTFIDNCIVAVTYSIIMTIKDNLVESDCILNEVIFDNLALKLNQGIYYFILKINNTFL